VKTQLQYIIIIIIIIIINTTNAIHQGSTGIVRESVCLYDVQGSTCLVDAFEDYNWFGEVSFFVVSNVSKWNKEQRINFV
jgi:hypothetical protein